MTLGRLLHFLPIIDRPTTWRCTLCPASGTGGVTTWAQHYTTTHLDLEEVTPN